MRARLWKSVSLPIPQRRSGWWRFSKYELRDGKICPGRGARLEQYHPWDDYEKCHAIKGGQPPYQSLVQLSGEIRLRRPRSRTGPRGVVVGEFSVSDKHVERILEWTSAHGLLGILPHSAFQINCDPVPDRTGRHFEQLSAYRESGCWSTFNILSSKPEAAETLHYDFSLNSLRLSRSPTVDLARKYFLDNVMHLPFDPDFAENYCEPILDWVIFVREFTMAVKKRDVFILNGALASSGQTIEFENQLEDAGPRFIASYASLIAAYALMFALDVVYEGGRLIECLSCGAAVVATAYQQKYCSRNARHAIGSGDS